MDYNKIIENVLTPEEESLVREIIDGAEESNKMHMDLYNQQIVNFRWPDSINQKIIDMVQEITGLDDLELYEYQYAKYQKIPGKVLPNLTPHYDDAFDGQRFTFDFQIGGNTTWPIVLEGKEFELKNNQALLFSGTHQIHWRTQKEFQDDEYIEMIFCHTKLKGDLQPESKEFFAIMDAKQEMYREMYRSGGKE